MNKEQIRAKIQEFEINRNGLRKINGADVMVRNIKIRKREKMVCADVTLINDDEGRSEKYNDCNYSFDCLGVESITHV